MTDHKALFSPTTFGPLRLKHRVIMAPLTRSRSIQPDSVPGDLMRKYYEQRASDGGLIISEATNVSLTSRGWVGRRDCTPINRSKAGRKLYLLYMHGVTTCLRNFGIRDTPRMLL